MGSRVAGAKGRQARSPVAVALPALGNHRGEAMLANQGRPMGKPSMGSRASGGERCASERLPPSAMRARRWASTPRRPRWSRPALLHCPRFTTRTSKGTRTSLRASPSGSSRVRAAGPGSHRAERGGSDSTSSSDFHIGGHGARLRGVPMVQRWRGCWGAPHRVRWRGLGRSTSHQVARLFEGWTGQSLGGLALADRPDRRLGLRLYCAIHCASCRGKPWSKPSTCGSDQRTGFAVRPPRRSRCTWCERAIQRARSWARFDATGWVRILGGVHAKAGVLGRAMRQRATATISHASPALGKPLFGWASTGADDTVHVLGGVHAESGVTGEGPSGPKSGR